MTTPYQVEYNESDVLTETFFAAPVAPVPAVPAPAALTFTTLNQFTVTLPAPNETVGEDEFLPLENCEQVQNNVELVRVPHLALVCGRKDMMPNQKPLFFLNNENSIGLLQQLCANDRLLVSGASGSGKTATAFIWTLINASNNAHNALNQAEAEKTAIVWVSLPKKQILVFFEEQIYVKSFTLASLKENDDFSFVQFKRIGEGRRKKKARVGCLIIDGVKNLNAQYLSIEDWCKQVPLVKVITSEQAPPLTENLTRNFNFAVYNMRAWSLDLYQTLCDNQVFFTSVVTRLGGIQGHAYTVEERRRLVEYKYFYAGRSVRYMFEDTIAEVKSEIEFYYNAIPNKTSFASYDVGIMAHDAVKKLLFKVNDSTQFVCEFFARFLSEKLRRNQLALLQRNSFVTDNPVMNGWTLQADYLFCLRTPGESVSRSYDVDFQATGPVLGALNVTYQKAAIKNFHRNVPNNLVVTDIAINNWFIPEVFYQGGYDCVQILPGRDGSPFVLRFVQITRNVRHSLKLHYMFTFLNAVNACLPHNSPITVIDVVLAFPDNLLAKVPNPTTWARQGVARNNQNPIVNFQVVVFQRLTA